MGRNYKKIQYESEGAYASTEKHWLYIESSRSCDYVNVYDENGNRIFGFGEWGNFDMGDALIVALSNWNHERMKDLTIEEIQKLRQK
jgi:hypothetical protein